MVCCICHSYYYRCYHYASEVTARNVYWLETMSDNSKECIGLVADPLVVISSINLNFRC